MSLDKIYMTNQIATLFKIQADSDRAGRVAAHLHDFWEPRML
jgi:formate dehydrogenase subunit delta